MPSRRYFITIAPVSHINGKMAPCYVKCPNTTDPEEENPGFWYGFKRRTSPVSRFGVRYKGRNLNTHPVTTAEDENRSLFTLALQAVNLHRDIAADWALMLADFDKQSRYQTPNGFAVAECRANSGQWPARWTS